MTIGALELSPAFDSEVLEYTATTTNASNKVTAVTDDPSAVITIDLDGVAVANGTSLTWASGDNVVTITVTDGVSVTEYVVTVNKVSTACDVIGVTVPADATIGTNTITASVLNSVESTTIDVTPSTNATWKLYSDETCETVITDNTMALSEGTNTAYIKVTAEDTTTTKVYTLTVTKLGE